MSSRPAPLAKRAGQSAHRRDINGPWVIVAEDVCHLLQRILLHRPCLIQLARFAKRVSQVNLRRDSV